MICYVSVSFFTQVIMLLVPSVCLHEHNPIMTMMFESKQMAIRLLVSDV